MLPCFMCVHVVLLHFVADISIPLRQCGAKICLPFLALEDYPAANETVSLQFEECVILLQHDLMSEILAVAENWRYAPALRPRLTMERCAPHSVFTITCANLLGALFSS